MRPAITANDITNNKYLCMQAFEYAAKAVHYKALFLIQKDKDVELFYAMGVLFRDAEFANACINACNNDKNYTSCMGIIINNKFNFLDIAIPTRKCDFKVTKNNGAIGYYYIAERIAINYYDEEYNMCLLVVDEKCNKLFYTYEEGDPLDHFSEMGEVGLAYKGWIAEQELLK